MRANSFDFWKDCDRSLTEENSVAELLRPPQHLSHGERLTQVSRVCKETCLSKGESLQCLGGISSGFRVPLRKIRDGYLPCAPSLSTLLNVPILACQTQINEFV